MPQAPQTDDERAESGLVERLADDPASRAKFLRMAGGTGAAAALSAFIAACGGSSKKTTSAPTSSAAPSSASTTTTSQATGDLAIVNYALTLEYLETEFYKKVATSGLFSGKNLDVIKRFRDQEQMHVDALKATVKKLGGTPVAKPNGKFPLKSAGSVLKLAATVENLGAAAYLGQAAEIQSPDVLAAALSIHSVEARHASALNQLLGKSNTPDGAFAKPADMQTVLAAVKPFLA